MNDKLPPLPEHTGYMAHNYDLRSWDENDLRTYAAQAVAAALSDRHALQGRGEHPAPCARQCEAQAFRSEIAAEQRRSEMYADLVRRTAEALGLTREDGWQDLPERVAVLCEANECFGKRQEWWTEKMFQLEQERDALKADADKHYAAGWIAAAKWAERDDLISDIDSPAYIADRDAAIDNARSKE